MLKDEDLSYCIRGCAFEVYKQLGHGFLEIIYRKAMVAELIHCGINVREECPVGVAYKGQILSQFKLDLVVEDRIILELKAQDRLPIAAEAQLINYLKATSMQIGLLINFRYPKATIKRLIL